jgi:proton-dependent oligopeptide transporter, POT family
MSEIGDIALTLSEPDEQENVRSSQENTDIEPTAEELATLEHISDRIPPAVWLIVICEFCERFAFFGLSGPFQNYIQFPVPGPNDKQPGALGRGQRAATSLTTFFRFLCYLTPIPGAIVADQYLGKYKTILFGCVIYAIGLLVLALSSIPSSINAGFAFPGLIVAMIILGFATGGVKSNVSPLMAEQYTRTKPIVRGNHTIC